MKLFFDGGWRPSLGMETAVVVGGEPHLRRELGAGDSMTAEWLALLHAAEIARERGLADPVFVGDALAVIEQARGAVPSRGAMRAHRTSFVALTEGIDVRLRYVTRGQNLAGIALARFHDR